MRTDPGNYCSLPDLSHLLSVLEADLIQTLLQWLQVSGCPNKAQNLHGVGNLAVSLVFSAWLELLNSTTYTGQ